MRKLGFALTQAFLISLLLISFFGSMLLVPFLQNIGSSEGSTEVIADWTYMCYLDADNNLDSYGVDDLNEMEEGYDDSDLNVVNVITFIDRMYSGGTTYRIREDADLTTINSDVLSTGFPSEPDMGAQATLKSFIKFCINNYPADKYCLDLWDHGGGVFGICWDDSDGHDYLTFDEVDQAIAEALSETGETKIDVLSMDACLMHMLETDYELAGSVDYLVASEETIPGEGFDYYWVIQALCANPAVTPYNYAVGLCNYYYNFYAGYDVTLSAVDLRSPQFDNLMVAFNDFIDEAVNVAPRDILAAARAATTQFYYDPFVDLKDFLNEVASRLSGYPALSGAITRLQNNISTVVINNKQRGYPQAYGIAIYFPDNEGDYDSGYATVIDLGQDTDWEVFLDYFWNGPTYNLEMTNFEITGDGVAQQSETTNLAITVKNTGSVEMYLVNGTLSSLDANVTVDTPLQTYGDLVEDAAVTQNFQITVDANAPTGLIVDFFFFINATISDNYLNYARNYTLSIAINVSIFDGGSSFDTAVSINGLVQNKIALLWGMLPGPDPRDYGTWYKMSFTNASKYIIGILLEAGNNTDFDIYIYTPTGSLLTAAAAGWYPDYCSTFLPTSGDYRIKVVPYSGLGVFHLNVTESDIPGIEDGYSWGTAYSLTGNETDPATVVGFAPSPTKSGYIFYRVYIEKGWALKAIIESTGNDFDVYIVDRNFQALAAGQGSSYPDSCQAAAKYTGYLYILIVPKTGSGSYTLTVEWKEPFHLELWMMIVIGVIVVLAVIVGIWIFFKMAR
jgi:hypothetical protein